MVGGGLGEEGAAADVAGDEPVAFQPGQGPADLAARGGELPGQVAFGGKFPAGAQDAAGGLFLQQRPEGCSTVVTQMILPLKPIKTNIP